MNQRIISKWGATRLEEAVERLSGLVAALRGAYAVTLHAADAVGTC